MIHISDGNSKLGKVPNISLPPVVTCRPRVPCRGQCYARKAYRLWPNVKVAWDDNWDFYQTEGARRYFEEIRAWLLENKPRYFRWHVSGDVPDVKYFENVFDIARHFGARTRFMLFTKRWDLLPVFEVPENLTIILSMWPRLRNPRKLDFPRAWLSSDKRKPDYHFKCPGKCDTCYKCWELVKLGHDVVFDLH